MFPGEWHPYLPTNMSVLVVYVNVCNMYALINVISAEREKGKNSTTMTNEQAADALGRRRGEERGRLTVPVSLGGGGVIY